MSVETGAGGIPAKEPAPSAGSKSPGAFRTITEVAAELDLPQHVLRFWETKFPQIRPMKRRGGRRYYRPEDVVLLREVRRLLYVEGYTIRGVQKLLRQQSRRSLAQPPEHPGEAEEADGDAAEAEVGGEAAPRPTPPPGLADATPLTPLEAAAEAAAPSQPPKWRRDMEMSTVLRKELYALLCELEELRALLPDPGRDRSGERGG
jgi:DNA-binding transcriptional MerR regulator